MNDCCVKRVRLAVDERGAIDVPWDQVGSREADLQLAGETCFAHQFGQSVSKYVVPGVDPHLLAAERVIAELVLAEAAGDTLPWKVKRHP